MVIDLKKLDKARNSKIITKKISGYKFWIPMASFFGAGYSPTASGTVGTLVIFIILFTHGYLIPDFTSGLPYIFACLFVIPFGALVCQKGQDMWGDDASRIVMDEVVGMMWTLLFIDFSIASFITLFFLFRFFDIFKLPPAKQMDEKMHNGWGILLDDVVAGVYANLTMRLILFTCSYIGSCNKVFQ